MTKEVLRKPIKIICCHASQDSKYQMRLEKHLYTMIRLRYVEIWHERLILPGTDWVHEVDEQLNTADIILLLISPDFMASHYCYSVEMQHAISRYEAGEVYVIPIIVRPVDWKGTPIEQFQVLPTGGKPITHWSGGLDEGLLDTVRGIRKTVEILLRRKESEGPVGYNSADYVVSEPKVDWGEAPLTTQFYGREKELAKLEQQILDDHCRMVGILGIGGIGKTSLATRLVDKIKGQFEYVFWRSLQNAPPLGSILKNSIQFFSNQQRIDQPDDIENHIALLLQYLRNHRCLFVLDNVETILQSGSRAGYYRSGYDGYGRLIQCLGEARHQSCLLLTSREKPKEVAHLEGKTSPVHSLQLLGLGQSEGQKILEDKGVFGSDEALTVLNRLYSGNPLALKLASEPIRELFGGEVSRFLEKEEAVVGDIYDLLDQQFHRLSEIEREITYWLAIEREKVSLDDLQKDLAHPMAKGALLEGLKSLRRRSIIEVSGTVHFTLQPVVMEYATDRFVEQVYKEIDTESIKLFGSHVLIKAQTKDYVRDSQVRLILAPVVQGLLRSQGEEEIEKKLKSMLLMLRETYPHKHLYAAGNILNLLLHLECDLRGYDFSHLTVWQAYLQGKSLPEVSFVHANLARCVFTETLGSVLFVVFSPNGELLVAGTANGEIRFWSTPEATPLLTYSAHDSWVWSVAFSPDGSTLASGSEDQTVCLWEVSTGRCLKTLQGHTDLIRSVAFSPDGSTLASGSEDQTVRLWEVGTGQCLTVLQGHTHWIYTVAFSPDGSLLASGSEDQTVRLWEMNTGECFRILQGHTNLVRSVAFSPDGSLLASGSEDQTVRLWEMNTGECFRTLQGHINWIYAVAFSPDGSLLASGGEDQMVCLWELRTGRCLKTLQGHTNRIRSVAFSPDGSLLASGGEDQTVCLWELSTGERFKTLQGHTNRVIRSVAFSPDGSLLASGSEDQTVCLWRVSTGRCLTVLQGHTNWVGSVAFSPDGSLLASGSEDQTVRLWEVNTHKCFVVLQGHTNLIYSVAFSPDGEVIASGSNDGTVKLWNAQTGQCLKTLQEHTNLIYSVAFSPDGEVIASGSNDGAVKLWNVQTGQCLKTLRRERPYERMNIFGVKGLTETQKVTLRALGATQDAR